MLGIYKNVISSNNFDSHPVMIEIMDVSITGHISSCDIEENQAIMIAEDSTIQRKYMGAGVERLPIKVYYTFYNLV